MNKKISKFELIKLLPFNKKEILNIENNIIIIDITIL